MSFRIQRCLIVGIHTGAFWQYYLHYKHTQRQAADLQIGCSSRRRLLLRDNRVYYISVFPNALVIQCCF